MSNFEEHEAEQARITAECEAGECDHPECQERDDEVEPEFRYLAIEAWAQRRYRRDGKLVTQVGTAVAGRDAAAGSWGVPSRYSVIEDLAAAKYLGTARRWPGETLDTAFRPWGV